MFSLLHLTKPPDHYIRLTASARADIAWRQCFLQTWSGTSFLWVWLWCSSGGEGTDWFQIQWPQSWEDVDTTTKELVPVVAAAAIWGKRWCGLGNISNSTQTTWLWWLS